MTSLLLDSRVLPTLAALCVTLSTIAPIFADDAPGIAVGEAAPQFTLPDQNGTDVALEALLKDHNVALVFYRSAGW